VPQDDNKEGINNDEEKPRPIRDYGGWGTRLQEKPGLTLRTANNGCAKGWYF